MKSERDSLQRIGLRVPFQRTDDQIALADILPVLEQDPGVPASAAVVIRPAVPRAAVTTRILSQRLLLRSAQGSAKGGHGSKPSLAMKAVVPTEESGPQASRPRAIAPSARFNQRPV